MFPGMFPVVISAVAILAALSLALYTWYAHATLKAQDMRHLSPKHKATRRKGLCARGRRRTK